MERAHQTFLCQLWWSEYIVSAGKVSPAMENTPQVFVRAIKFLRVFFKFPNNYLFSHYVVISYARWGEGQYI
jgi:hypothetical protein